MTSLSWCLTLHPDRGEVPDMLQDQSKGSGGIAGMELRE
jgi:hypothetical protein